MVIIATVRISMTSPAESARQDRRRWLALIVVCLAMLMNALDATVVNVALPKIQHDLHFTQAGLAWVIDAYLVAFAGFLLMSGRLGDLIGRKRLFVAGLLVFTAASLLSGAAVSQGMLVAARFAQGIGGAMAAAVVLGISMMIFPEPHERAKALGVVGFVTAAGGTAGGVAGGFLIDAASWHWVFFVNVPVGITAATLAVRLIPADLGPGLGAGVDAAGAVLATAGLMLFVYAIVEVPGYGWGSEHTLGLSAVSVVLLAVFVVRQATGREPLLPLRIFRSRNLSGANVCQVLMVAPMFAFSFLSVLYLQQVLGYSPAAVGLAGLPLAALLAVVSLGLSARMVTRLGLRTVLLAGLALIAAGLALFARVPVHGGYIADVLPAMLLIGGGAGLAMPALMGFAMSSATPGDAGLVSGLFATGAQVGGALGLAVLAALATARTNVLLAGGQATAPALTAGYHFAFGASAGIAGSGILLAASVLRPPASPAANTADPHHESASTQIKGEA
jgi:EmrB/QacA subfamily drug resistance transporter